MIHLQACLNGSRTARDHPAIPITPEALARDARAVRDAGANSLHIHPRDMRGRESLAAIDVGAALRAIRAVVPDMPIGISVGEWIAPGGAARLQPMRNWTEMPDFVAVDLNDPEANSIVGLMQARGVGIEASIRSRTAAMRFASTRMPRYCMRILLEVTSGNPVTARAEAEAMLATLPPPDKGLPIILHGERGSVWEIVRMAAERQLGARAGLEDGPDLPGGAVAANNAALVAAAARILKKGAPARS